MKKQYSALLVLSALLMSSGCDNSVNTNNNSTSINKVNSSSKLQEYTITWVVDGETSNETYTEGEMPIYKYSTEKEADETYVYTFTGWDKELTPVDSDETYTAQYSQEYIEYVYTWVVDGTETKENYHYGDTPTFKGDTSKEGDAQYSYVFTGWDKELTPVDSDETLVAQYDVVINEYEVTWVVDGTETKETYEYGEMPIYNGTPTKDSDAQYTYTFSGWDKELSVVVEDVTYTAEFSNSLNEYVVTWVVGNEETKETYKYGELPSFKGSTDRESAKYTYTFIGWDKNISEVVEDITYIAQYDQTINSFTVNFYTEDGTIIESKNVEYDAVPIYTGAMQEKNPTVEYTYAFGGWENRETGLVYSGELPSVIGAVDYYATFVETPRLYDLKVNALNLDGTLIRSETKQFGYNTVYSVNALEVTNYVASKDVVKGLMNTNDEINIYYSMLDVYDGTSISSSLVGEGTEDSPYLISSGADLAYLRNEVNVNTQTFAGVYFKLTKSIDLTNAQNFIIGNSTTKFAGYFDGNNCSIRGINLNLTSTKTALFYVLSAGGVIENISTYGTVAGGQYAGGIVGQNAGTIRNCTNYVNVTHSGGNSAGGVAGGGDVSTSSIENSVNYGSVETKSSTNNKPGGITGLANGIVKNCTNFGTVSGYKLVGGVVAEGAAGLTIDSCYNYGNITFSYTGGGITSAFKGNVISNCVNYGQIELTERTKDTADYLAGGIASRITAGTISKCINNGHIIGGGRIGGIVGQAESTVSECINNGIVESLLVKNSFVGGIIGVSTTIIVSKCINNGKVIAEGLYSGGIVGCVSTAKETTVEDCVNNGEVTSSTNGVGGIIGGGVAATSSFIINNCTNKGLVEGNNKVGGIAGLINAGTINENCVNTGTVKGTGTLVGDILGSDQRTA